jgi:TRAP-type C4-dicarboxylate transport system substrate-binding protein
MSLPKSVLYLAAFAFAATPAAAATVKMTAVAFAPPTVSNVKALKEIFVPEVTKRLAASGRDFKIDWTEAFGATLATSTEIFETVEEGVAQVGLILKTFEESKLPLEQISYVVPFAGHTVDQMVDIDSAMRHKIPALNEAYAKHNQVFLLSAGSPGMDLFTTFPVKSVDDIKGHKIGASGALGNYLRGTGAVLVNSTMSDSYTSIRNGLYDGYILSVGLAFPLRTYQAAKYRAAINFGTTATSALTVNTDAWKKLPDFAQAIFHEAAAAWANGIKKIDAEREKIFLAKMAKEGVVVTTISPEERRRWALKLPNIAQEWAEAREKEGLPGKLVLKTYMDELRARHVEIARMWDRE